MDDATGRGALPSADEALSELADLTVAHEELRVAEEELHAQQVQIADLLAQHDTELRWRAQVAAVLPVGLATTDENGKLLRVNAALAAAVRVAPHALVGKPLTVYLSPGDVSWLRDALRDLTAGTSSVRQARIELRPRGGMTRSAELIGLPGIADSASGRRRVEWLLQETTQEATPGSAPAVSAPDVAEVAGVDGGGTALPALAAALVQLSGLAAGVADIRQVLARLILVLRGAVPGADWVSLTLGPPETPEHTATDGREAQAFDGAQLLAGEGPCMEAYASGRTVTTADATTDPRWPGLGRVADSSPVRAVLAVPISMTENRLGSGVLNVYAGTVDAFGPEAVRNAEILSSAVTGVLDNATEQASLRTLAANLQQALESRAVIDQAKGILMFRLGVDAEAAFTRLAALSNRLNVKVRDLAGLVVQGHVDEVLAAGA